MDFPPGPDHTRRQSDKGTSIVSDIYEGGINDVVFRQETKSGSIATTVIWKTDWNWQISKSAISAVNSP